MFINKVRFADDTAIIAKTQEELQDMVNRLVDNGRKYGMEINIDRSQVMRDYRNNESLQIIVNYRELKEVDHFKYLGSVITRDGYCTREIKKRIALAKEAFNRKMPLLTSKLNIELKKKLIRYNVWGIDQLVSVSAC
jgi:Reverse transcriptase (RNA-dependent DNA polymerase).